jgi:U3 small nucleolar RNA-associated protein 13
LKLWNIKNSECVNTYSGHENKIWGLDAIGDKVVTGSVDSSILLWTDITAQVELEELEKRNEQVKDESDLNVFLLRKDYEHAIKLAIKIGKPMLLLNIFTEMRDKNLSDHLSEILSKLPTSSIEKILEHVKSWNTSVKYSDVSQFLIHQVLKNNITLKKDILDALIPYTQKHYERVKKNRETEYLLEYLIECMN